MWRSGPASCAGSSTHCTDSQQRIVDLSFTKTNVCARNVTVPNEPNLALLGWWMLSIVETSRRPSDADWVKLS